MLDIGLSLLVVLGLLLLVLLVLGLLRRRRAQAPRTRPMPISDAWDDTGTTMLSPGRGSRGSHGRHAAVPAGSTSVLMLMVPVAVKRRHRHRPLDVTPRLVSIPAESIDDLGVVGPAADHEPDRWLDREPDDAVIAVARPSEADAQQLHTYQRRVAATVQAISQRVAPGESPEVIEARLLAAMDRLDGPLAFVRPRLSPAGALPRVLVPPQLTVEEPVRDEPEPEPEPQPPVVPDVEDRPMEPSSPQDEVVLPVPPPPPSADPTRRRGLRSRGNAG